MSNENEAQVTKSSKIAITMDDGRTVEFSGKRKMVKETTIDAEKNEIVTRLDFLNGETRYFNLPATLLLRAAAHGIEQKLGDEIAGVAGVDDCVAEMDQLLFRLDKGEWNMVREGGNGSGGASILVKALMELTGKDRPAITEFLSDKTQAEKIALRTNVKLKPIVERLEAERNAKAKDRPQIDTDKLMEGLGLEAA